MGKKLKARYFLLSIFCTTTTNENITTPDLQQAILSVVGRELLVYTSFYTAVEKVLGLFHRNNYLIAYRFSFLPPPLTILMQSFYGTKGGTLQCFIKAKLLGIEQKMVVERSYSDVEQIRNAESFHFVYAQ